MKKINPYFDVNGNRYELRPTRWLIAEYQKLNEERPLDNDVRANAIKASNLIADVKKYNEKASEWWDELCENPTPEKQTYYLMFKEMSDKAVEKYNDFVAHNNSLSETTKHTVDILEIVAVKALAEQYYNMNESLAKQTWESFVDSLEDNNKVGEWLFAMSECLFGEEEEEEDNSFLSQKKKMDLERDNNRKSALRKKK